MKKIKIDGVVFEVPESVANLFDMVTMRNEQHVKQVEIHKQAGIVANKQLSNCRYLLSRLLSGEKIDDISPELMDIKGEKLRVELQIEREASYKHGLTGWIYKNWGRLSVLKCECNRGLIDYEAVRTTGELICSTCNKSE